MTLEEAIKISTPLTQVRREGLSLEEALAVQLLIEAGKWRQRFVAALPSAGLRLLPGETKD